jgi:E3 ubiquitin-protein ligase TRIP12
MNYLAVALQCIIDERSILRILGALKNLLKYSHLAESFLEGQPDFPLLLDQANCPSKYILVVSDILEILLMLVPAPWGNAPGFIPRDLAGASDFAVSLQPFAEGLVFSSRVGCGCEGLRLLSSIYRYVSPTDLDRLLDELTFCLTIPYLVHDVFLLIINMRDREKLLGHPILLTLDAVARDSGIVLRRVIGDFPVGHLPEPLGDIDTIDQFSAVCGMPPAHFFLSNAVPKCTSFLHNYTGDISPKLESQLGRMLDMVRRVLGLVHIPEDARPSLVMGNRPWGTTEFPIEITFPGSPAQREKPNLLLEFSAYEYSYNQEADPRLALSENPALSRIISFDELDTRLKTKSVILNRGIGTPGYRRLAPRLGTRVFSVHENIFRAASLLDGRLPHFDFLPADGDDPQYTYEVRKTPIPGVEPLLELSRELFRRIPKANFVCDSLSEKLLPRLALPEFITRFSSAASAIWNYPYLFPLDLRLLFFKITALNVRSALEVQSARFGNPREEVEASQIKLHCRIERSELFEQGMIIFERFGPGRAHLDIKLDVAFGLGPSREFFALFSAELCKFSRSIWRNKRLGASEFVDFGDCGLFPRPAADPRIFHTIGIFCAKAIFMGCLVSLPINPVFWDIAWGNTDDATAARVDPEFVRNLEMREGLEEMLFLFLDDDADELVPDGDTIEVGPENMDLFVHLTKEKLLCRPQAEAFAAGFGTVLPWDATRVFTAEEMLKLLNGTEIEPFTLGELEANITIEHGYQADSPQIRWLFGVLTELNNEQRGDFMQFVTGVSVVPLGGIAGLDPKLAVARRLPENKASPDETLPSVMTCTGYFKLPEYSSREILRERLLTAIALKPGFGFD